MKDFTFSDKDVIRIICNHLTPGERENVKNYLALKKDLCSDYLNNDDISFELVNIPIEIEKSDTSEINTIEREVSEIQQLLIEYVQNSKYIDEETKQTLIQLIENTTLLFLTVLNILQLLYNIIDTILSTIRIIRAVRESWFGRRPGINLILYFLDEKIITPLEEHIIGVQQKVIEFLANFRSFLNRLRNFVRRRR